jgi:hypothetical protein
MQLSKSNLAIRITGISHKLEQEISDLVSYNVT